MRLGLLCICLCCPLFFLGPPRDPQKLTLYVVESESCGPCREFAACWTNTLGFADRLRSGFNVRGLHWENEEERALAQRLGVTRLPAFVVVSPAGRNLGTIVGFTSEKDLLNQLRLQPLTQTASQSRTVPKPAAKPKAGPMVDDSARREISRLEAAVDLLRRQLQDVGKAPESSAELQTLKAAIEELRAAAAKPPAAADISTEIPTPIRTPADSEILPAAGSPTGLLAFALKAVTAIALPEVALPMTAFSVAASLGGWLLGRRGRRSAAFPHLPRFENQSRVVPITVESPPPPQVVHTETRFVDIEKDTYAQAHAWAVSELVRKYPGLQSFAETLHSLITQFLNAKG